MCKIYFIKINYYLLHSLTWLKKKCPLIQQLLRIHTSDTPKNKIPAPKEFIFLQVMLQAKRQQKYLPLISAVKGAHDPNKVCIYCAELSSIIFLIPMA